MTILGISSFYHDSAAVLLIDGKVVAAIEEERLSRLKHDNGFPFKAIEWCLKEAGLSIDDIDIVSYYEKPLVKFERLLETFVETYPRGLKPFIKAVPDWIGQKINVEHIIRKKLGFKKQIYYIPHHLSHAAAGYYSSSFSNAAILTIDGVGEHQTTGLWVAQDGIIKLLKSIDFPHSIGLLYSVFTAFLDFKVNEDEYKLMGMSAYGKSIYKDQIIKLTNLEKDGSFKLDMSYFSYRESFRMYSNKFIRLFGQPKKPKEKFKKRHKDIASSVQAAVEEVILAQLNYLYNITHTNNLCIAGGVALNALANGKIYDQTPFKKLHILGSAGDSGAAIGSALYSHHVILRNKKRNTIKTLNFGSSYSNESIKSVLDSYQSLKYKQYTSEEGMLTDVATYISKGKIVGWFQGRCEFGPRALGNRSILTKPSPQKMKDEMNKIKRREEFRPFAGSILQEHVHEYFHTPEKNYYSPFMNVCLVVREEKRKDLAAIVHEDNTCRIQTVSPDDGRYYRLINKYYKLTELPCVLNTSFNVMGEPIVEHPRQAIEDYLNNAIDFLILEDFLCYGKHER
ncbi:carbamoyltransferase [Patescibacteria group bacterium]